MLDRFKGHAVGEIGISVVTLAELEYGVSASGRPAKNRDALNQIRRLAGKEDWLAVLKECPVSMDDVPPRRREFARRRKGPFRTHERQF